MPDKHTEIWDLYYPKAAATGLPFARGRIAPTGVLLVHAAPPVLTVTVYQDNQIVAQGIDLPSSDETPMTRLTLQNDQISREDIWPTDSDLGALVILPGGEVGTLKAWWHAADHSEWRWQVEFYNHR